MHGPPFVSGKAQKTVQYVLADSCAAEERLEFSVIFFQGAGKYFSEFTEKQLPDEVDGYAGKEDDADDSQRPQHVMLGVEVIRIVDDVLPKPVPNVKIVMQEVYAKHARGNAVQVFAFKRHPLKKQEEAYGSHENGKTVYVCDVVPGDIARGAVSYQPVVCQYPEEHE